jgi:hypothetical protein
MYRFACANAASLKVITPVSPVDATLEVWLTGSPIKENYGLWWPMTPAITLPTCMPTFTSIWLPLPYFLPLTCFCISNAKFTSLIVFSVRKIWLDMPYSHAFIPEAAM